MMPSDAFLCKCVQAKQQQQQNSETQTLVSQQLVCYEIGAEGGKEGQGERRRGKNIKKKNRTGQSMAWHCLETMQLVQPRKV